VGAGAGGAGRLIVVSGGAGAGVTIVVVDVERGEIEFPLTTKNKPAATITATMIAITMTPVLLDPSRIIVVSRLAGGMRSVCDILISFAPLRGLSQQTPQRSEGSLSSAQKPRLPPLPCL
jgi:hypothetical protein